MPQYNYSVNWNKIIKENLPFFLHQPFRLAFCRALIKPFKVIYAEFLATKQDYIYKVRFNGQENYLTTILNERFDPTNQGIYISDGNTNPAVYLYFKSEGKPPRYLHRRWKITQPYQVDDYAVDGKYIYTALYANTGQMPSANPSTWQLVREVNYLHYRAEFAVIYDFIINVPASVVFNINQMRSLVDFYRLAGVRYKIVIY